MKNTKTNLSATTSNIPELTTALDSAVSTLNKFIASNGGKKKVSAILGDNKAKLTAVYKALRELNELMATEYYKATPAIEVIKTAAVPCKVLSYDKKEAVYSIEDGFAHPSIVGMKDYLSKGIVDRVDVLRRCGAYLAMEGMEGRESALYGVIINDKKVNVPTEAVKAILPKPEEISKSAVKNMLTRALRELTEGDAEPLVTSALLKDFSAFCVKRTGEWGVRTLAAQEHVGDIVLEYAHMLLTGKTNFTVKVVSK